MSQFHSDIHPSCEKCFLEPNLMSNNINSFHQPGGTTTGHPVTLSPRGSLARTLYNKYQQDQRLQRLDKNEWYRCGDVPESARDLFQQLSMDAETQLFLDQASQKSDWVFTQVWHSIVKTLLGVFLSQTSINGLLGRGSMFVFSQQQFVSLMGDVGPSLWGGVLLDLGAGDGRTTQTMAPLFRDVYATEVSSPMRWLLLKRGFRLLEPNTWTSSGLQPDVISCLNLLDRCEKPLTLLHNLHHTVKPGGRIIIAIVLPYNPYVEIAPDHKPTEELPIIGNTFEQQVASAISNVFEPAGFHVERWSRLPYLCEGDLNQAFYWLDDAVFVLSVPDN